MAITKSIIKINHIEAILKVVNDTPSPGTVTFGLATDLLRSDETLSGQTPTVNLGTVESAIADGNTANITRGGQVILNSFENTIGFSMSWGADPTNNTDDIVVNMSGLGTMYIRVLKVYGYKANFIPEQGSY